MRSIKINSLLCLAVMFITGCGSIPEPKDGRTMRDIYDQQMAGTTAPVERSARPAQDVAFPQYHRYTRDVKTEIENLFPRLPNPTLYMYVRPHTVGIDGLPIPGYTVPFSMYERDQHAMPGEVAP